MKYLKILIFVLMSNLIYSQTGITYQALIFNPSKEEFPGQDGANSILKNTSVCVRFTFYNSSSFIEYQEVQNLVTDEFGMINTVIGIGRSTGVGYTSFSSIFWSNFKESLTVDIDTTGRCSSFVTISEQVLSTVPFAYAAQTSDNVTGIVSIANGGTGASTVTGAKLNLGLDNVNNTTDLNKPISRATQSALDLKENTANKSSDVNLGSSNVLFPTQNAVKVYVDNKLNNIVSSNFSINEIVYYVSSNNESKFKTPSVFSDAKKLQVYRNGVEIDFVPVDTNTIKLESGIETYANDKIKIIQFK